MIFIKIGTTASGMSLILEEKDSLENGAPGAIRTPDRLVRSYTLRDNLFLNQYVAGSPIAIRCTTAHNNAPLVPTKCPLEYPHSQELFTDC